MIRAYRPEDAPTLAAIFHAAVRVTGAKFYSGAQVEAWSPAPPPRFNPRLEDGRQIFVATAQAPPVAFIELEPNGHIDRFYCHPDHAGTGVGSALYAHLEKCARATAIAQLTVEASEAARAFFAAKGFTQTARRDFILRGVAMHNYAMKKTL